MLGDDARFIDRWRQVRQGWQTKVECAARAFAALQPQAPAVPLDQRMRDIQANAKPRIATFLRLNYLIELLENALVVPLGDADAKVLHSHLRPLLIGAEPHDDRIGPRRIFDGVGEQIDENLPQTIAVTADLRAGCAFYAHLMGCNRRLHVLDRLTREFIE